MLIGNICTTTGFFPFSLKNSGSSAPKKSYGAPKVRIEISQRRLKLSKNCKLMFSLAFLLRGIRTYTHIFYVVINHPTGQWTLFVESLAEEFHFIFGKFTFYFFI